MLVFALALVAAAPEGAFYRLDFAEKVKKDKFDPDEFVAAYPPHVRFEPKQVVVEYGQETVPLELRYNEPKEGPAELFVRDRRKPEWRPVAFKWVGADRIETDLMGEREVLVKLDDYDRLVDKVRSKRGPAELKKRAGTYATKGGKKLELRPDGKLRIGGKDVPAEVSRCFLDCQTEQLCLKWKDGMIAGDAKGGPFYDVAPVNALCLFGVAVSRAPAAEPYEKK